MHLNHSKCIFFKNTFSENLLIELRLKATVRQKLLLFFIILHLLDKRKFIRIRIILRTMNNMASDLKVVFTIQKKKLNPQMYRKKIINTTFLPWSQHTLLLRSSQSYLEISQNIKL